MILCERPDLAFAFLFGSGLLLIAPVSSAPALYLGLLPFWDFDFFIRWVFKLKMRSCAKTIARLKSSFYAPGLLIEKFVCSHLKWFSSGQKCRSSTCLKLHRISSLDGLVFTSKVIHYQ
jgi:hypothetical protein